MNRRSFIGVIGASSALAGCASVSRGPEMHGENFHRPWAIVGVHPTKIYDRAQPPLLFYDGPAEGAARAQAAVDAERAFNEGKVAGWFQWRGPYYKRYEGLP